MKIATKLLVLMVVVASAVGCRDKAAERRIAELEARLAKIEGDKTSAQPAQAQQAAQDPGATTPEVKPEGPIPAFKFERIEYDFGQIKQGEKVAYSYKFTNTGDAPLIIQSVQPSCGCTAPDWSKDPVPVGGTGFVKVEFDSNGKEGVQNKMVTVLANTWPKQLVLRFKATVNAPPAGGSPLR